MLIHIFIFFEFFPYGSGKGGTKGGQGNSVALRVFPLKGDASHFLHEKPVEKSSVAFEGGIPTFQVGSTFFQKCIVKCIE